MNTVLTFKAFSDPTRQRIMNLLLNQELNVNEIMETLNMGQSRISRHLKILADAGLLTIRKDGLWSFYSAPLNGEARRFIDSVSYLFIKDDSFDLDFVFLSPSARDFFRDI